MKKKVLFLMESFITGGAERVLLDLANAMDKTRFDVTVVSVFKKSVYEGYDADFEDMFSPDVHRKYLIDNTVKWKYLLFNYFYNKLPKKWFHRILIGKSYDTEVAFYEGLPTVFLSHSSNKKSKKIAWLHHGNWFVDSVGKKKEEYQKLYSGYDVIVGVSKGIYDNFKNRVCQNANVVVRYNVYDEEKIKMKADAISLKRADGKISFLAVGRVCEMKGYDRLLRVCLRLKEEGFLFCVNIIGGRQNREYSDGLKKFIEENSMSGYVSMLGNKGNPYPYMKVSDWLVSSSYAEGFSTVIAESMIIGTPVISTLCSGTKELLGENNEWGICCENSEEGLYEAMKGVLTKRDKHDYYKDKAMERGSQFKKKQLLGQLEDLF